MIAPLNISQRYDSDLHSTRLHEEFGERVPNNERDAAGGYIGPSDLDEKKAVVENTDVESEPTPEGGEPNEHEKRTLRRVGENLPASAYLIAIVELTERFTYYGWSIDDNLEEVEFWLTLFIQAARVSSRTTSTTVPVVLTVLLVLASVTRAPLVSTCSSSGSATV